MIVIYAALMAAVVAYAALAVLLQAARPVFPEGPGSAESLRLVRAILYAAAVLHLPAIFLARRLILRKKPEDTETQRIGRMMGATIVVGALAESAAIYGLLLVILGRDLRDFYILGGYALVLLAAGFPRFRNLEEWVQGARKG